MAQYRIVSWLLAYFTASAVVVVTTAENQKVWLPRDELSVRVRRTTNLNSEVGWGPWSSPSNCSRPCGGGVSRQIRECLDPTAEDDSDVCQGAAQKYTSCNTQSCPEGTIDFREQQCSVLDTKPFEGRYYRWVPYVKKNEPCQLNCRPEGERFYYQHREKVEDGTSCGVDGLDMCVDGQCVPVGCDRVLGSKLREDKCRECGGDGSACNTVQKTFDKSVLKAGYNDILLIPKGATYITIEETEPTNNYLALRSVSGDYYLNGDWSIDISGSMSIAGTRFTYERKPLGYLKPESIRALGPINESLYVVLLYQEPNKGIRYEYSVPRSTKHLTDVEYVWRTSQWSSCSRACGTGEQGRSVGCVNARTAEEVEEELCNSAEKPEYVQQCSIEHCNASWSIPEWSECTSKCGEAGVQYRHVTCRRQLTDHTYENVNESECVHAGVARPEMMRHCSANTTSCPRLYVGPWSHCSQLCGEGVRTRHLVCHTRPTGDIQVLPLNMCSEGRSLPQNTSCFLRPCQGTDWMVSQWSSCKDQCGISSRTRTVVCAGVDGTVYSDSLCRAITKPKSQTDCPEQKPCQYRWFASHWSQCSSVCGSGVRTRSVFCAEEVVNSNCTGLDHVLNVVNDSFCKPEQKYHTVENCTGTAINCSAKWMVGPWAKCSKECGEGFQTRKIFCVDENGRAPVHKCSSDNFPLQIQSCNRHECSPDNSSRNARKYYCVSKDGLRIELEKSSHDGQAERSRAVDDLEQTNPDDTPDTSVTTEKQTHKNEMEKDKFEIYEVDMGAESSGEEMIGGRDDLGTSGGSTDTPHDLDGKEIKITEDSEEELSGDDVLDILSNVKENEHDIGGLETSSTTTSSVKDLLDETYIPSTSGSMTTIYTELNETHTATDATSDESTTIAAGSDMISTTASTTPQSSTSTTITEQSVTLDSSTTEADDLMTSTKSEASISTQTHHLPNESISFEKSSKSSTSETDDLMSSTNAETTIAAEIISTTKQAEEMSSVTRIKDPLKTSETDDLTISSETEATAATKSSSTTMHGDLISTSSALSDGYTYQITTSDSIYSTQADETTTKYNEATFEAMSASDTLTTLSSVITTDEMTTSTTASAEKTTIDSIDTRSKNGINKPNMKRESVEEEETFDFISSGFSADGSIGNDEDSDPDDLESEEGSSSQSRMVGVLEAGRSLDLSTSTSSTSAYTTFSNPGHIHTATEKTTTTSTLAAEGAVDHLSELEEAQKSTLMSVITETTSIIAKTIFGFIENDLPSDFSNTSITSDEDSSATAQIYTSTMALLQDSVTTESQQSSTEILFNAFGDSEGEDFTEWTLLEDDGSMIEKDSAMNTNPVLEESGDNEEASAFIISGQSDDMYYDNSNPKIIDKTFPDELYEYSGSEISEASGSGQMEDDQNPLRFKRSASTESTETKLGNIASSTSSQKEENNSEVAKHNVANSMETGRKDDDQTTTTRTITMIAAAETTLTTSETSPVTTTILSVLNTIDSELSATDGVEMEEDESTIGETSDMDQSTSSSITDDHDVQDSVSSEENEATPETLCTPEDMDCSRTEFGCCPDGLTPARGPFLAECPPVTSCQATRFGCCPDMFTPARTANRIHCPSLVNCSTLLFGCCEDGRTPRSKPDDSNCNAETSDTCNYTRYGCCPDGLRAAEGPRGQGCPDEPVTEPTTPLTPPSTTLTAITTSISESTTSTDGAEETSPLCNETIAEFGCCTNTSIPAHGPHQLGCCLQSEFSCCPDFITPASDSNKSDCTCHTSTFGCCHDNVTSALGPDLLGCSCESGRYGCCPDGVTMAQSPDREGCDCNSTVFGCCPDGITPTPSSNLSSCSCEASEYGCCPDGITPAPSLNLSSCSCEASEFGCCLDGVTSASGEDFLGCSEIPMDPAEVCTLPQERGNCREYTVRWFFDVNYGGCSRFWYSGCRGNANSFETAEKCKNKCVLPSDPLDICKLPKIRGACDGQYPSWFYNKKTSRCEQFVYGGCLGNANRFETENDCRNHCSEETTSDACLQKVKPGPCRGALKRWFFNSSASSCQAFEYGGCHSNLNNFLTEQKCQQRCSQFAAVKSDDRCKLPKLVGNCSELVPRWFFDEQTLKCSPFYYSGCEGNNNRFNTRGECQNVCQKTKISESDSACDLSVAVGKCSNFTEHFHFDSHTGQCRVFNYSGCQGNANRFNSLAECESVCIGDDVTNSSSKQLAFTSPRPTSSLKHPNDSVGEDSTSLLPDEDRASVCSLASDPGPCRVPTSLWFFSTLESRCLPFVYGGCGGNENKFVSEEQCERVCRKHSASDPDFCSIPPSPGDCHDNQIKWYFDYRDSRCRGFAYTGCGGNGNRFTTEVECESLCINLEELPVIPAAREEDEQLENTSTLPEPQHRESSPEHQTDTTVSMATESDNDRQVSSDLCQQEQTDCKNIRCPLGVERHVTSAGCQKCTCYNPCHQVDCPHGQRCVVQYRSLNNTDAQLTYTTLCRQVLKKGRCPVVNEEVSCHTAWTECRDDADCPHQLKCCYDGCTMRCAVPATAESTTSGQTTTVTSKQVNASEEPLSVSQSPRMIAQRRQFIPARILTTDGDTVATEGSLLTLNCVVEGEPAPTIFWLRGQDLVDTSRGRYKQESSGALTIVGVSRDDSGSLTCVANNSASNHDRRSLSLTVTAGEPHPAAVLPQNSEEVPVVKLGRPALLRCHAYGWPRPSITWWRGTSMLPRRSRHFRSRGTNLRVLAVRLRDLGVYTCQAYNGLGRAVSWSVPLRAYTPVAPLGVSTSRNGRRLRQFTDADFEKYRRFLVPARVAIVRPESKVESPASSEPAETVVTTRIEIDQHEFAANSDIRVSCHVTGYPSPAVTWYKNGAEITGNDRVKPLESALIILRSRWSDGGNYTCQARNQNSVSASSVEITVSGSARDANCTDNPYFANCRLIVAAKYCNNPYYAKFCCRSCTDSGQLQTENTPNTGYRILPHRNVSIGRIGPFHEEERTPRLRVRFGTTPPLT